MLLDLAEKAAEVDPGNGLTKVGIPVYRVFNQ